jgi:hypothetical protein
VTSTSATVKGIWTYPDGTVYEGDVVNGKQHGKGKYTWPDGAVYEGDFVDSQIKKLQKNG